MSDSWNDMKRAKEEQYFQKENEAALNRLKARTDKKQRLSPITGEPMQETTVFGVVIDRCPSSKGIWLDAGELEQIMKNSQQDTSWFSRFWDALNK